MPDLTPAETLTAAAERLRWLLHEDGMPEQIRGSWLAPSDGIHGSITAPGQDVPVAQAFWGGVAEYAATMHPGVGLALVDWLDYSARRHDALVQAAHSVWPDDSEAADKHIAQETDQRALTLARQLLGGAA